MLLFVRVQVPQVSVVVCPHLPLLQLPPCLAVGPVVWGVPVRCRAGVVDLLVAAIPPPRLLVGVEVVAVGVAVAVEVEVEVAVEVAVVVAVVVVAGVPWSSLRLPRRTPGWVQTSRAFLRG